MYLSRIMVILLAVIGFTNRATAQEFGGNPPSLKWKQVNTDTVRVIFPAGLEKQASDIARIVHDLASSTQYTIGGQVNKVNIVLQNQTTLANGYVGMGPFRSEFQLTPNPNNFELGSLPWHKTLALHEYRHVQQFNNFRKGLSMLFYVLFGEEGLSLANSTAIPNWFWEGDAVYQETLTSGQGRGSIPYFFNDYRSLWAANKNYSWMKLRNGSLRDQVPDHYRLGYMMVAYGREKFGDDIWRKVTDDAARFRGLFYPFQSAVKRNTGESFDLFRKNAIDYFRTSSPRTVINKDSASAYASRHRHFVADEQFPQWVDASHIVYVKTTYKKTAAFYIRNIDSGSERMIRVKDISSDTYFSYRGGKIIYSAFQPDLRWGWKNYGIIKVVDITTGQQRTITKKTKYFSPDISGDGARAIAVHYDPQGNNELHILSVLSGKIIHIIPNKQQLVFTNPKFYDSERVVAAVRNVKGEMALGLFDISTGNAEWLTPFSLRVIGFPQVNKDTVSFSMSDGTQDKLFAVAGGKLLRFQPEQDNSFTGNYQLSMLEGKYVWTAYTAVGFYISRAATASAAFVDPDTAFSVSPGLVYPLTKMFNRNDLLLDTSTVMYPSSKYSQSFRLFNLHSWRPYFSDPEYTYSLVSQNILNTLQSEIYGTYNRNEKFKETGVSLAYAALFPIIRGGASYTFDRSFTDTSASVNWNEFNANLGLTLPLSFTSGKYYRNVSLSGSFNTQRVFYTGASKSLYPDKQFNYGETSVSATNQLLKSRQQIYPRFAQTLLVRYRWILNKYTAHQFLINGSLYFPGLFNNHSLVLQGAYQLRDTMAQYNFSNGFSSARGYSTYDFPRLWKLGANYHFPIVYPDLGIGNIAYLLRIRGNVFYDYSQARSLRSGQDYTFRSAGGELFFDSMWWNELPVSFGFRYSRLIDHGLVGQAPNQWEFVLPINLLNR